MLQAKESYYKADLLGLKVEGYIANIFWKNVLCV